MNPRYDRIPTPVIYPGGKTILLPHITPLVKPHRRVVDLCGGGAAFILWDQFEIGVYNDVNAEAVNFFRVCQDRRQFGRLYRTLRSTAYSRNEFFLCDQTWEDITDPVERARRWFVVVNLSFTHETDNHSFRVSKETNVARAWANHITDLHRVHDKFHSAITIEELDFRTCYQIYGGGRDTLIFADPPYINEKEEGLTYRKKFTTRDHYDLIQLLNQHEGQSILCGYPNKLYANLLDHDRRWRHKDVVRQAHVGNADYEDRETRTERIWVKDALKGVDHPTLW